MVQFTLLKCPSCQRVLDSRMVGISSFLGRPQIVCPKCGTPIDTEREEWTDFSAARKLRFFLVSLLYAAACGFICAAMGGAARQYLAAPDASGEPASGTPGAVFGAMCGVLLVAVLQVLRVRQSLARSAEPKRVSRAVHLFDLDNGLQAKVPGLLIVVGLLGYGVCRLAHGNSPAPSKPTPTQKKPTQAPEKADGAKSAPPAKDAGGSVKPGSSRRKRVGVPPGPPGGGNPFPGLPGSGGRPSGPGSMGPGGRMGPGTGGAAPVPPSPSGPDS